MDGKASPQFIKYIKQRGLKWTPEREKVLREALAMKGHFEADELAFRLRKKGSRISRATVYRTLPLLVKAGLLNQVIHGEKHQHYEPIHEERQHDHLICLKCGKITEFQNPALKKLEEEICRENDFRPQKILVEIFGYCRRCR